MSASPAGGKARSAVRSLGRHLQSEPRRHSVRRGGEGPRRTGGENPKHTAAASVAPPRLGMGKHGSFAASVLSSRGDMPRRGPRDHGDRRPSRDYGENVHRPARGGPPADRNPGRSRAKNWFESTSRAQALAQAAKEAAMSKASVVADKPEEQASAFAGGDLRTVLESVPDAHWVAPFLREVCAGLGENNSMSAARKQEVLTGTVDALSSFGLSSHKNALVEERMSLQNSPDSVAQKAKVLAVDPVLETEDVEKVVQRL